jgi:hypothetical protein
VLVAEDAKIRNFLLLNKCSVENTKQKIDMYYTIRSLLPDWYEHCNPKLPFIKRLHERKVRNYSLIYFFDICSF